MRADLHTHSNRSDGTDSPEAVIGRAAEAGLDVVALTDHDTADGWDEAMAAGERLGVRVLPGIEVSTERGGSSLHLLGFHVDPQAGLLAQEMDRSRISRESRAREMVERLSADYPISWDDVAAQFAPGTTIGRPHIADALVAAGSFADRDEAFVDVLGARSRYHVRHYAPDTAVAVAAVREAGGVPVLAHSLASRQRLTLDAELLEELVAAGLAGLEVHHRDHDARAEQQLLGWARRHGLIVTGGSDYHGTGKRNEMAENLTAPDQLERIDSERASAGPR